MSNAPSPRTAILVALVVAIAPVAPVAAAPGGIGSDTATPALSELDAFVGYNEPDWLQTYADGQPGVYVTVTNGSQDALESWVDASADRQFINGSDDDPWVSNRTAYLRAPYPRVLGGFHTTSMTIAGVSVPRPEFPGGLVSQSYVTRIDPAVRVSAEPVQPEGESAYTRPVSNVLVDGAWTADGIAFGGDVNATTLGEARTAVRAGDRSGSASTRIAVLDTGLNVDDTADPALYGSRIVAAKNFVNSTGPTGLANVSDGSSSLHGSWTAAAIAANATNDSYDGMCTSCELAVGKVLADDGSGSTESVREGIAWADRQDADIISVSLGSTVYSETLADELRDALAGNVTAVYIAAGNSRMRPVGRFINSPADVPEAGVLTVGATTNEVPANASSAYFSSVAPDAGRDLSGGATVGQEIDVAAPGFKVEAPVYSENGFRENRSLSGTSMATPIAAGVGGLVLSANPSLENDTDAFTGYIRNTSAPVPAAGVTEVGHGMVDATNATALTPRNATQADARTAAATGRDQANRAYSGGGMLQFLAGVGRSVAI
jgi:subtilisin family serine protease